MTQTVAERNVSPPASTDKMNTCANGKCTVSPAVRTEIDSGIQEESILYLHINIYLDQMYVFVGKIYVYLEKMYVFVGKIYVYLEKMYLFFDQIYIVVGKIYVYLEQMYLLLIKYTYL